MYAGKADIAVITQATVSTGLDILVLSLGAQIILILIETWAPTVLVWDVSSKKEQNAPSWTKPRFLQAMPCLVVPEPRDQMLHNSEIWDKWLTRLAFDGEGAQPSGGEGARSDVFLAALMRF